MPKKKITKKKAATGPRGNRAREEAKTARNKVAFLEAYATAGVITAAAQIVGIGPKCHYRWLKADKAYADAFTDKQAEADDALIKEARRRAVNGVQRPIIYKGKVVIDPVTRKPYLETQYSDTMLIVLLKMRGLFKDKFEHSGPNGGPINHEHQGLDLTGVPTEKLVALRTIMQDIKNAKAAGSNGSGHAS